jgi:hypothetical protein
MNGFFRTMGVLIERPGLALLPALLFLALYFSTRKVVVLVAGLTWLGYCLYETGMKQRILCGGECNIRIDLIAIYPMLIGISLIAAIVGLLAFRRTTA